MYFVRPEVNQGRYTRVKEEVSLMLMTRERNFDYEL